jgi:hypothetical protein
MLRPTGTFQRGRLLSGNPCGKGIGRFGVRPPPHTCTTTPWPADRARPRHRRARFQHRVASAMSSCSQPPHFIFSWYRVHTQIPPSPPRPPPPHRALPLRGRPIARDPGTAGPGFSIASPRPCCKSGRLKMARPSGASFSPKKAPLPVTPPSHTSPPRRSAPTAAARSRQTRIRFQDCIALGMPSCSSAQHGTSVGGHLQPQKCTYSPNRHVYEVSSVP